MGDTSRSDTEDLAALVKAARSARNWSQAALALASGINEKTVRRLEAGAAVSGETIMSVCAALDIKAELAPRQSPERRHALPTDSEADPILATLAARADPTDFVLAVDPQAYLRTKLGPDFQRIVRKGEQTSRFIERAFVVVGVPLLITWTISIFAGYSNPKSPPPITHFSYPACVTLILCFVVLMLAKMHVLDGTPLSDAQRYLRKIKHSVFAVGPSQVTRIDLGQGGVTTRVVMPLRNRGRAAASADEDHIDFEFDLHGATLRVPSVPRNAASEALAASLA